MPKKKKSEIKVALFAYGYEGEPALGLHAAVDMGTIVAHKPAESITVNLELPPSS